jgi:DNA topoisomerase-1
MCPIRGHHWKRVVHDPSVTWLAYYKDSILGGTKYVFLAASSSFKGQSDLVKYEKARKLGKHIEAIRKHYEKLLVSGASAVLTRVCICDYVRVNVWHRLPILNIDAT